MLPKVSIVTVSYNCKDDLIKTIKSVKGQIFKDYEFIIIDGNSSDGTKELLKIIENEVDVIISEPDKGIYDGMNKGLGISQGEWIIFMNAGDVFHNKEVLLRLFANDLGNFSLIYGDTARNLSNTNFHTVKAYPFFEKKGIRDMGFCHQSVLIKTILAKELGFDTNLRIVADYKMIYSLFNSRDKKIFYFDDVIARIDPNGISQLNPFKVSLEIASFFNDNYLNKFIFLVTKLVKFYAVKFLSLK